MFIWKKYFDKLIGTEGKTRPQDQASSEKNAKLRFKRQVEECVLL